METSIEAQLADIEVSTTRLFEFTQSRQFGVLAAFAATVVVCSYVFLLTPYTEFLISDMAGFWNRAMERLDGEVFRETQFMAWPPSYHILLAEFFRLLQFLGLENLVRLETPLLIHILVFGVSVYALQRALVNRFSFPILSTVVVLLYGLGFPAFYFHAFLLPDNLATSLLVIACACILCRSDWKWLVASALIFGFASCIRPAIAPYGLPFIIYLLIQYRFSTQFFYRAAAFTAVFFSIVGLATLENSRISGGKVNGLSANGGLDFFIANSRYHSIRTDYDGWNLIIIVPALSMQPENGYFYTDVPIYNQDYYFKLGWDHIKRDPMRVIKNLEHVKHLFFSDMLPTRYDAPGFSLLRPVWDVFKFIMLLSIIPLCWFWRWIPKRDLPFIGFLICIIFVTFIVSYLFTGEPRYTYSIIFCFYILFFKLIDLLLNNWPDMRVQLIPAIIGSTLLVGLVHSAPAWVEPEHPSTVAIETKSHQINPLWLSANTKPYTAGRVLFPFSLNGTLRHSDIKDIVLNTETYITVKSVMEVIGDSETAILLDINSGWPTKIFIDEELYYEQEFSDYFEEQHVWLHLDPGKHDINIEFDFIPYYGGFSVAYNYLDQDDKQHHYLLGVNSERVRFELP